jgi:hypothetical protein
MAKYYRDMFDEDRKLCAELEAKLLEIEEIEAVLDPENEVAEATGSTLSVDDLQISQPGTSGARTSTPAGANQLVASVFSGPIDWTQDDDDEDSDDPMDGSNVERMLERSIKPSTLSKYARSWDKWVQFSTYHEVDVMPQICERWRYSLRIQPSCPGR